MKDNKFTVIITTRAKSNIRKIIEYLDNNWNTKVTNDFIDSYERCTDLLSVNPYTYPESSKDKKFRICLITKHNAMYYRIIKDTVLIITIRNTNKNPKTLVLK